MSVKLLTEHRLEFLSLKGGFTNLNLLILLKVPSREKALLTLHVVTEMHFLLQKNLKNIMHGRVKMYAMR